MNDRDLALVDAILDEIRNMRNSTALVFNTNFTQIAKTNLLLLKGLLDIDEESGFFVVLDRPHQYMSYLLHMHKIGQEKLWYIDTVTHMSGVKKETEENVDFLEGPFHIENLFDKFELQEGNAIGERAISPKNIDFFLIDNISTMLNYNTMKRVEEFILSFEDFIDSHSHIMGGITIDRDSHPELSEVILDHFDYMVDIEEIKKEVIG